MTEREHRPLNYDVLKDRRQAGRGCRATLPLLIGLAVCAVTSLVWGFSQVLNVPSSPALNDAQLPTLAQLPTDDTAALKTLAVGFPPTNTQRPTQTLTPSPDSWGATGTALLNATASPTLNYCWWQTPSPTPTSTLPFTPDSWGATGTAVYVATNPYRTPTPPPPRELCDRIETWTPTPAQTATLTPLPFLLPVTEETTPEVSPAYTLPVISPPPTWTLPPGPTIIYQEVTVLAPPPEPVIVTAPPVVITSPPIIIQPPPQIIIITPTLGATVTSTASQFPTSTPSPTTPPTETPTSTPSATPTDAPTVTPTSTPSATPTGTPTLDQTEESA